jgi:hypothetical protein
MIRPQFSDCVPTTGIFADIWGDEKRIFGILETPKWG